MNVSSHRSSALTLPWCHLIPILLCGGLTFILSSCAAITVGSTVVGGSMIAVAQREGHWNRLVENLQIANGIRYFWEYLNVNSCNQLKATPRDGRVLLTGVVRKRGESADAARLVWQVPGVKEVYNEIEISGQPDSFVNFSRDIWIRIKLRSFLERNMKSRDYALDVTRGTVYLVGIAKNKKELKHVLTYARNLKNVKRVVSYVRVKGDRGADSLSCAPPQHSVFQNDVLQPPAGALQGPTYPVTWLSACATYRTTLLLLTLLR